MNHLIIFSLVISLTFSSTIGLSQSLEEKRTYHDIYTRTNLHEIWTVKAGTNTKHGTYKEYDRNGGLMQEVNFRDNLLDGERKSYYLVYGASTGQIHLHQVYKHDELIEETSYFKDGSKNYHKVVKGKWTYWHTDGTIGMVATLKPGGSWNGGSFDLSASDSEAPQGDDFYILNSNGELIKVDYIKFYLNNELVGENYFNEDGFSFKNVDYDLDGNILQEWQRDPDSGVYTKSVYYDNGGGKALSSEFILSRKPGSGSYQHYIEVLHGTQAIWTEAGDLINQGTYREGVRVGDWQHYYDRDWNEVNTPEEASYYRLISYDEQGRPQGLVKDFFINDQIQWEGSLISTNPDVQQGKCTWYYENGNKEQEVNYQEGVVHGKVIAYNQEGFVTQVDSVVENQTLKREFWKNNILQGVANFYTLNYNSNIDLSGRKFDDKGYGLELYPYLVGSYKLYYSNGIMESEGLYNHNGRNATKFLKWNYYNHKGILIKVEQYSADGILERTETK